MHAGTEEKVGDVGTSAEEGGQKEEEEPMILDTSYKFPGQVRDPKW